MMKAVLEMKQGNSDHAGMPIEDATKSSSEKSNQRQEPQQQQNDKPIPVSLEISTHPIDDSTCSNSQSLEDRVNELEAKLSTLSLLLSQQKIRRLSPSNITPPESPRANEKTDRFALDSPAPLRPSPQLSQQKRNLSFQILHGDSTPPSETNVSKNALFLPNNLPARPESGRRSSSSKRLSTMILQKKPSNIPEEPPPNVVEEVLTPKSGEKLDIKTKWVQYLNSFQESNYDVDLQMEEFVKIPSAVEALLGFGFWICVDSFLYVLTVLPIRFVWSLLLLIRYIIIWAWKRDVPDGPFRFHRRYEKYDSPILVVCLVPIACLSKLSLLV